MNFLSQLNSVLQQPLSESATEETTPTMEPSSTAPTVASAPRIPGLMHITEWEGEFSKQQENVHFGKEEQYYDAQPVVKKQKLASTTVPIPLSSKPRGDFAARLNGFAQTHRLRAEYGFGEGPAQVFFARLALMDMDQEISAFKTSTAFGSKKAAKEAVAEKGVEWFTQQETPSKKSAKQDNLPAINTVDNTENWTGVLNELCQQRRVPVPEYSFYSLGCGRFAATCTHSGCTYGDPNTAYTTKKNAKSAAAHAAVSKLREDAILAPRPAVSSPSNPPRSSNQTSLSNPTPFPNPVMQIPSSQPLASSLVPALCDTLSLTPPQYKLHPDPEAPIFVSGAAYFKGASEPELKGPVGAVERIYGKGNAKEQCAKEVLAVLERLRKDRLLR